MPASCGRVAQSAQLVLVFGATVILHNRPLMESIRALYPTSADTKTQTHGFPFSKAVGADRAGDLLRPQPNRSNALGRLDERQGRASDQDVSPGPHRIEQRHDIDSRVTQSLGRLGIRHLINSALDFGHQEEALLRIARLAREHIHEGIDLSCRRFQLVTIESVAVEMHERIARLCDARTQRAQLGQNCGRRRTR